MKVAIIDYGAGNVFSVQQALLRAGVSPLLTNKKEELLTADRILFPGVGHAAAAMSELRRNGLDRLIPELRQPVLGICLGMQLLCRHTEEGNITGLGVFDVHVGAFSGRECVPHMGWNDVTFPDGSNSQSYYFVHRFRAGICPHTTGICEYEAPFSAQLQRNNFYGVQFHPEKSGKAGDELIRRFLNGS